MTRLAKIVPPRVSHVASDDICPCCSGPVYRIQRRSFDRFVNFFIPLYRYRCGTLGCGWEGNLPAHQKHRGNDDASRHDQ